MTHAIILLFSIAAIGFFCNKMKFFPQEQTVNVLKKLVLNITIPAIVLLSFANTPLSIEHLKMILAGTLTTIAAIALFAIILRPMIKDNIVFGTLIPAAFFSNAGFLGLPIIEKLFGQEGISLALPFNQFSHSSIMLFTIGIFFFSYYGSTKKKPNIWKIIKEILLMPMMIAIPIGIAFQYIPMPALLSDMLTTIASANTFMIMFAVGMMLNIKKMSKHTITPAIIGISATLIAAPLIAYFIGKMLSLEAVGLEVITLETAMPMAVLTLILAKEYSMDVELAEMIFIGSTVMSIITLPLVQSVLF